MNYKDLPSLFDYLDRHFRLDVEQDYPHDSIEGWFRDIPCTVTRTAIFGGHRPRTRLGILLRGQVVCQWDMESEANELKLHEWFNHKRTAVVEERNRRRQDLERFFKFG